jgi:hypothetical protein
MGKQQLPGREAAGPVFARGDRVQIRPGVGGGVDAGDEGTVRSIGMPGASRPVKVALDADPGDPRDFAVDELELIEAATR